MLFLSALMYKLLITCASAGLLAVALHASLQAAPFSAGADKGGQAVAPRPVIDQKADLRELITPGIASGKSVISIHPGRYRFTPQNREHLVCADLKNITVHADGLETICTQTTRAISSERCENFTLRGLVIDYDPLPFTQARITTISADQKEISVAVIDGYPEPKVGSVAVEVFDLATNELRGRMTFYGLECAIPGPAGLARLTNRIPVREAPFGRVGGWAKLQPRLSLQVE